MLRKPFFLLALTGLALVWSPYTPADDLQDIREWASAMAFVESRGLDISKGIESKSGVWRIVIEEGDGALVRKKDTVMAHATGWLADGTKFWSSLEGDGSPMVNDVTGFVKGFTEGLQTMKAGGTSLFVFPGKLGYGRRGNPGAGIPPNATLIFEVILIAIE